MLTNFNKQFLVEQKLYAFSNCTGDILRITYYDVDADTSECAFQGCTPGGTIIMYTECRDDTDCSSCETGEIVENSCLFGIKSQCIQRITIPEAVQNETLHNVTHYLDSECKEPISQIIYVSDNCASNLYVECNSTHMNLKKCDDDSIVDSGQKDICLSTESMYSKYSCTSSSNGYYVPVIYGTALLAFMVSFQ